MNRNYRRGRAYEYRVIRMLENTGFTAFRSAGSHGCADVIAVNRQQIRFVQVKCGERLASPLERETFKALPLPANATREIWHFKQARKPPLIHIL